MGKLSGANHVRVEESIHCETIWSWEIFTNVPMVPPPQTSPNHIEHIDDIKIKPKTFITSDIAGGFDFNKTPLAPPGTKVIIHKKPV